MKKMFLYLCFAFLLMLITFIVPDVLLAQECTDKCDAALIACSAAEAKGCDMASKAAGEAVSALADQAPIPGMGKLLGGSTKKTAEKLCKEKLAPCKRVMATCYESCGEPLPAEDAEPSVTNLPPKPVEKATFRVFSNQPKTLVYINGERMGATPSDSLEPYITPELLVGKYWVRLVSVDKKWVWEGAKDVKSGNVNAVEGMLWNLPKKDFKAAEDLEFQEKYFDALAAFRSVIHDWPDEEELVENARKRIIVIQEKLVRAEEEFFTIIQAELNLEKRLELCLVYKQKFDNGPNISAVKNIYLESKEQIAARQKEETVFKIARESKEDEARKRLLIEYINTYPQGRFVEDAKSILQIMSQVEERLLIFHAKSAPSIDERRMLLSAYLQKFPFGKYRPEAEAALKKIRDDIEKTGYDAIALSAPKAKTEKKLRRLLNLCTKQMEDFPEGIYSSQVQIIFDKTADKLDKVLEQQKRNSIGQVHRRAGVGLMAGGGAIVLSGLIVGGSALSERNSLEDACSSVYSNNLCPDGYAQNHRDSVASKALAADILLGIGIASATVGVMLYMLAPSWKKQESKTKNTLSFTAVPLIQVAGAAVSLSGEF